MTSFDVNFRKKDVRIRGSIFSKDVKLRRMTLFNVRLLTFFDVNLSPSEFAELHTSLKRDIGTA